MTQTATNATPMASALAKALNNTQAPGNADDKATTPKTSVRAPRTIRVQAHKETKPVKPTTTNKTASATLTATKKTPPVLDAKNPTVEAVAVHCLLKGLGGKATLERVKAVFPGGGTTMKCIYYYASTYGIALRKGAQANQKELRALLKEIA